MVVRRHHVGGKAWILMAAFFHFLPPLLTVGSAASQTVFLVLVMTIGYKES